MDSIKNKFTPGYSLLRGLTSLDHLERILTELDETKSPVKIVDLRRYVNSLVYRLSVVMRKDYLTEIAHLQKLLDDIRKDHSSLVEEFVHYQAHQADISRQVQTRLDFLCKRMAITSIAFLVCVVILTLISLIPFLSSLS